MGSLQENRAPLTTQGSACHSGPPGLCPRSRASPAPAGDSEPAPGDTADAKGEMLGDFYFFFLCLIDIIKGAVSMFTLETATAV